MRRSQERRPKVYPCERGDKLGRHRWVPRDTGLRTEKEMIVWDDRCIRCGIWLVDAVVREGDW
jgi:hypothetical protein